MGNFADALQITLNKEGGFSDHPADPGGKTMWGITEVVFQGWLIRQGKPVRPVTTMTRAEMSEIYHAQYWVPIHGDELPDSMAIMLFDIAVNSGPKTAGKMAQTALGLTVDGVIGNATLGAIREACLHGREEEVINRISKIRENFYRRLPTFGTFGKGWLRRNRTVTAEALSRVEDEKAPLGLFGAPGGSAEDDPTLVSYNPGAASTRMPQPIQDAATNQGTVAALAGGAGGLGVLGSAFGSASSWVQSTFGGLVEPKYLVAIILLVVAVLAGVGWWKSRKANLVEVKQTLEP